jgi:general secretion pathway protein A
MYEKFFYLKEKPFHITPDPRFLFLSSKHREAMELLCFGVSKRKGFIVLTGEVGTGKTTLCRVLLEKLPSSVETALILNPLLSDHDLLKTITGDFGLNVEGGSAKAHIDRLNEFLLEIASRGGNAVVIIDEAQNLSPRALEMLRLLSNLETEKEKLLQIIMVGQPELKDKLQLPQLRQLNQRVIVRYHLNPLDIKETGAYIQSRLFVAGGSGTVRFTEEAVEKVYAASSGIPRMINIICDRALTAAFIGEKRTVDIEAVNIATDELASDGYLGGEDRGLHQPGYLRYMRHIALSTFVAALVAGIFCGPLIIEKTVLMAIAP